MARDSFAERWELTDDERAGVAALIEGIAGAERIIAHAEAVKARLLATAYGMAEEIMARTGAPSSYRLPERAIAEDIAAATGASGASVRGRMEQAARLSEAFPRTLTALAEARISMRHAAVIADEGARLTDEEVRARYERTVLDEAVRTTPQRLRPIARAVAERVEPTSIAERHEAARAQRRTWVDDLGQGLAEFHMVGDAVIVRGIQDRLTQMAESVARAVRTRGGTALASDAHVEDAPDERSLDQIRADVFADLVLTGHPTAHVADASGGNALAAIRANVQITVPAVTLTGAEDAPAFLAGHGPVSPDLARRLGARAPMWARLFVDPRTGCLRTVDAYVPTAEQRRFLAARDEHCRFPGCRRPVRRCDLDHTVAFARGGRTEIGNLAHLCEAHHVLKHNSPWKVVHRPGGVLEWTTPTGRRVEDRPPPTVRFVAESRATAPDRHPPPF
ncbi:HNH endonuclease signature motif containing protein [Microbacterium album]|uniref:HNH nuclease domain-containing protein n=1 Tax=Microbacterium album TaxID=2053191 RepID=A0A917IBR7_9MICO|nr:HNH endonuclease signature motif containing protein [Microbacterium album]GGH35878.1 hypothetical protein GCM10010921_04640 [Microbacterium album]